MTLGCLLLTIFYAASLIPILAISNILDRKQLLVALLIWGSIGSILLIPLLNIIIKKAWFFEGADQPVILDLLMAMLIDLNKENLPVIVKKTRRHLIITWRYDDATWKEHLEFSGLKKVYELHLLFDNSTKTVTFTDRFRSVNWNYSDEKVKTGWLAFPGLVLRVKTGAEWEIENYLYKEADTFSFMPLEIKSPILSTIVKNGWNVRFSIL